MYRQRSVFCDHFTFDLSQSGILIESFLTMIKTCTENILKETFRNVYFVLFCRGLPAFNQRPVKIQQNAFGIQYTELYVHNFTLNINIIFTDGLHAICNTFNRMSEDFVIIYTEEFHD